MHWATFLKQTAEQFDGGPRSFPLTSEAAFASRFSYDPPNEDYEKLFYDQAALSRSQHDALSSPHSAGWLIPNEYSVCKPVFIAHSNLSAIWLLRETLGHDALPDEAWNRLVCAAQSLAQDGTHKPSSTQRPSTLQLQQEQAATLSQSPPSKRARGNTPDLYVTEASSPGASDYGSPCPTPDDAPDEPPPRPTTTVSNHNRRAERVRRKKLEASLIQKRLDLGLVAPLDKASRQEHAAYTSIVQQDEPVVAWIIKQPLREDNVDLCNATSAPYHTACTLLTRARALGNPASRYNAALFLQAWRQRGSPFRGRGQLAASQADSLTQYASTASLSSAEKQFYFAWDMCDRAEGELAAVQIEYRWAAALLGQAYANKIAHIHNRDMDASNDRTRNRYGLGTVRGEAIASLLSVVSSNPSADRDKFRKRLGRASRWYTVVQTLGWGSLALMPHDDVPITWVESKLRVGELAIWLELVKKENPDVYTASKALDRWLGPECIAGGPIGARSFLSIEADVPATIYEVEDSEDDDHNLEDMDNQTASQSQPAQNSPTPAARLRQLTLLELFHPVA